MVVSRVYYLAQLRVQTKAVQMVVAKEPMKESWLVVLTVAVSVVSMVA